ncbi:MAG: hypothetical protein AAF399_28185 [Bacteroidota bacterium]
MKYHNPLRILQAQPEELGGSSSRFFKRVKRRLLAEFELQGQATIQLGEQGWDRDQLLKLLEKLGTTTDLAYHLQLLRYPRLMDYLEGNSQQVPLREVGSALIQKGMEAYLLPYLLPRLQVQLNQAVSHQRLPELLHLSRLADGLAPNVQAAWFQPVISSLLDWLQEWKREIQQGEDVVALRRRIQDKQEVLRLLPPYFEKMLEMYHTEARHLKVQRPPLQAHREIRAFIAGKHQEFPPQLLRKLLKDEQAWQELKDPLLKQMDHQLLAALSQQQELPVMMLSACLRALPEEDRSEASRRSCHWLEEQCRRWIKYREELPRSVHQIPTELEEQLDLWAHLPPLLQPSIAKLQRKWGRIPPNQRPQPANKRPWFLWVIGGIFLLLILIAIIR